MLAVKLLYCQTPDFTARTLLLSFFGISLAPIFSLVMTDAPEKRDERDSIRSISGNSPRPVCTGPLAETDHEASQKRPQTPATVRGANQFPRESLVMVAATPPARTELSARPLSAHPSRSRARSPGRPAPLAGPGLDRNGWAAST